RVTLRSTGQPINVDQKDQTQFLTVNQTSQISDNVRSRVAFNDSWRKLTGLLPSLDGSDQAGTPYGKTSTLPNWSASGNLDWVASPKVFVGLRGGYYNADQHDTNVPLAPRFIFSNTTNIGLAGVPVELQRPSNFASLPAGGNSVSERDQQTRAFFQADSTIYAHASGEHKFTGEHQFKFGVQLDRLGNNVLNGE